MDASGQQTQKHKFCVSEMFIAGHLLMDLGIDSVLTPILDSGLSTQKISQLLCCCVTLLLEKSNITKCLYSCPVVNFKRALF